VEPLNLMKDVSNSSPHGHKLSIYIYLKTNII